MELIQGININEFFKAIKKCKDDVYFDSTLGDHLNLKSTLSQYIFASIEKPSKILSAGHISCENPEDMKLLKKFIVVQ